MQDRPPYTPEELDARRAALDLETISAFAEPDEEDARNSIKARIAAVSDVKELNAIEDEMAAYKAQKNRAERNSDAHTPDVPRDLPDMLGNPQYLNLPNGRSRQYWIDASGAAVVKLFNGNTRVVRAGTTHNFGRKGATDSVFTWSGQEQGWRRQEQTQEAADAVPEQSQPKQQEQPREEQARKSEAPRQEAPKQQEEAAEPGPEILKASKAKKPASWEIPPSYRALKDVPKITAVLTDRDLQQDFGEVLRSLKADDPALWERVTKGEYTKKDEPILEYALHELAARKQNLESITQNMQEEDMEIVMRRNPAFEHLAKTLDRSLLYEAFQEMMPRLVMRDGEQGAKLAQAFEQLRDERKTEEYQEWETKTKEFLDTYDLRRADLELLKTSQGREALAVRLAEHYRAHEEHHGIFDLRALRKMRESGYQRRARRTVEDAQRLAAPERGGFVSRILASIRGDNTAEIIREGIDPALKSIGEVLAATVDTNALKKKVIDDALLGPKASKPESQFGPKSVAEEKAQRKAIEKITQDAMQQMWNRDKPALAKVLSEKLKKPAADLTEADWIKGRDDHWHPRELSQHESSAKGHGFWAMIFRAFFNAFITDKKRQVKI